MNCFVKLKGLILWDNRHFQRIKLVKLDREDKRNFQKINLIYKTSWYSSTKPESELMWSLKARNVKEKHNTQSEKKKKAVWYHYFFLPFFYLFFTFFWKMRSEGINLKHLRTFKIASRKCNQTQNTFDRNLLFWKTPELLLWPLEWALWIQKCYNLLT